jgi:hypothetical protein
MKSSSILIAGALFLGIGGLVQIALELLAYFAAVGPYVGIFGNSPYTIGFFEAHGLAVLVSVALARGARAPTAGWHAFAAGVHTLLGSANVMFWPSFVTFDMVTPGIVATVLHAVLVVLNGRAVWMLRAQVSRAHGRRHPRSRLVGVS